MAKKNNVVTIRLSDDMVEKVIKYQNWLNDRCHFDGLEPVSFSEAVRGMIVNFDLDSRL